MKAPDKIYIGLTNSEFGGVVYDTVSATFPNAKEYIRKDALLEWVKEELASYAEEIYSTDHYEDGCKDVLRQMIDKLNEM